MALNTYLSKVSGEKQGVFKSRQTVGASQSVTVGAAQNEAPRPFHSDSFESSGSTQGAASGQATGKRTHKPICLSGYY